MTLSDGESIRISLIAFVEKKEDIRLRIKMAQV